MFEVILFCHALGKRTQLHNMAFETSRTVAQFLIFMHNHHLSFYQSALYVDFIKAFFLDSLSQSIVFSGLSSLLSSKFEALQYEGFSGLASALKLESNMQFMQHSSSAVAVTPIDQNSIWYSPSLATDSQNSKPALLLMMIENCLELLLQQDPAASSAMASKPLSIFREDIGVRWILDCSSNLMKFEVRKLESKQHPEAKNTIYGISTSLMQTLNALDAFCTLIAERRSSSPTNKPIGTLLRNSFSKYLKCRKQVK